MCAFRGIQHFPYLVILSLVLIMPSLLFLFSLFDSLYILDSTFILFLYSYVIMVTMSSYYIYIVCSGYIRLSAYIWAFFSPICVTGSDHVPPVYFRKQDKTVFFGIRAQIRLATFVFRFSQGPSSYL